MQVGRKPRDVDRNHPRFFRRIPLTLGTARFPSWFIEMMQAWMCVAVGKFQDASQWMSFEKASLQRNPDLPDHESKSNACFPNAEVIELRSIK